MPMIDVYARTETFADKHRLAVDPAWKLQPRREVDDRADRRRARQPTKGLKEETVR
jgi:hypothetical protein